MYIENLTCRKFSYNLAEKKITYSPFRNTPNSKSLKASLLPVDELKSSV